MEGPTGKTAEKLLKKTREEKLREQKIESEIIKSLNGITDHDQKFQALLQRCVEAERISRSAQLTQKQNQKTIETLLLEKDNLSGEFQRINNTKAKLESLCRELQSQNKSIKEDSMNSIREEEKHRKEAQTKFQHSLNEIQKLMSENSEKNKKLEQDNLEMSMKFKNILAQYEEREKQMDRINKQMELVTQLNEAKLAKATVEAMAEKEAFLKQTAILEETITILKRQLSEALSSEKAYKAQVDLYSSKYGEFTKTFQGYKTDMTKMSKKTFKIEKEMLEWKIKYEKSNSMLLDMVSEKQIRDEHIFKTAKQLFQLQKLCRTLSAEKKAFYAKLIESNIDIPEVKVAQEEETPAVQEVPQEKGPDKLDEMVKSRDDLKKNLNQLNQQLQNAQKNMTKKSKKAAKLVQNGGVPSQSTSEKIVSEDEVQIAEEPKEEPSEPEIDRPQVIETETVPTIESPTITTP